MFINFFKIRHAGGGGPAPLVANPGKGACIFIMIVNVCLFGGSMLGLVHTQEFSCGAEFTTYLTTMGLFTASNVLFFFQVYQIRLGSDTEWSKAMMTTMGTSLLQCIQAFWGGRICLHAFTYRDMKGTVMYECYNRGRDAYCITVIVTMYFFLSFLIVVYTTWGIFFPPIRRNINQMKHVK